MPQPAEFDQPTASVDSFVQVHDTGDRAVFTIFAAGFGFLLTWTLCCQIVVLAGLRFSNLYPGFVAAMVAGVVGLWKGGKLIAGSFPSYTLPMVRLDHTWLATRLRTPHFLFCHIVLGLAFAGAAAAQIKWTIFSPVWAVCLVTAAAAWILSTITRSPAAIEFVARGPRAPDNSSGLVQLVSISAVLVAIHFFVSIPDADDSLFLNLAVTAKQNGSAVFSHDQMLGLPGLEFIKSTYRLESYILLASLVSSMSGIPVIVVAHGLIPFFMCVWAASALIIIYRSLFSRSYVAPVIIHILVLVALDGSLQSFGFHSVARWFQGKGPFVTLLVPLLTVVTATSLLRAQWRDLLVLGALIVVSIGLTANAVYAAPLAVLLVAVPYFVLAPRTRWRVLRLALVVTYPLTLVAFLMLTDPPTSSEMASAGSLGGASWAVMSSLPLQAALLILLFAGAYIAMLNRRMLFISLYTAGALLLVLNPALWDVYGKHVTGNINYRLFWAIPIPLACAVLIGMLWASRNLYARFLVTLIMLAGVLGPASLLHEAKLGFSPTKVPAVEFEVAKAVAALSSQGDLVLAPEPVSAWIPTLDNAPPVVEGRSIYIPQRVSTRYRHALKDRAEVFLLWNDPTDIESDVRATVIPRALGLGVTVVVVDSNNTNQKRLVPVWQMAGFTITEDLSGYLVLRRRR